MPTTCSNSGRGAKTLHRFLNIAEMELRRRMVRRSFSTNLPNLRDIDEALVRPGRCFAHVLMEELHAAEAIALLDRLCAATPERRVGAVAALNVAGQKRFSVAEVYAAHRNAGPPRGRLSPSRFCAARDSDRVAFGFN